MMGLSTAKLIGIGVGALAVIGLIVMVLGWRSERNELREWQTSVVTATRQAAENPKLDKKNVPQQIQLLGQAVKDLKAAIARQNAAIDALALEASRQQKAATEAQKRAVERSKGASAVSDRLVASSRSQARKAAPCEPSETVKEMWR
jgi:coproporphyrinogen III oxidase-like Fe-S oxidoreductase